jgi:hypothetical protein
VAVFVLGKAKPAGVTGGLSHCGGKKAATAGPVGSGDGFSQYETTDVPIWLRPKTYSHTKKPPLG